MDQKQAKKLAIETFKLQQKQKELSDEINKRRSELQNFFDGLTKDEKIEINGKNKKLVVSKKERVTIKFDPFKLREKLRYEIFTKVVAVRYFINDVSGFIKMLKKYNVPANEFKEYLDPDYIPNPYLIKEYYERGDIEPDEITGTFEAKITKYIDIRAVDKGSNDES